MTCKLVFQMTSGKTEYLQDNFNQLSVNLDLENKRKMEKEKKELK